MGIIRVIIMRPVRRDLQTEVIDVCVFLDSRVKIAWMVRMMSFYLSFPLAGPSVELVLVMCSKLFFNFAFFDFGFFPGLTLRNNIFSH